MVEINLSRAKTYKRHDHALLARLLLSTMRLYAICTLANAMAVLIGRQQPESSILSQMHLTDCELPCWIGIIPGKTTLAEANKRLQAVYGATLDQNSTLLDHNSTLLYENLSIVINTDDNSIVDHISLGEITVVSNRFKPSPRPSQNRRRSGRFTFYAAVSNGRH